MEVSRFVAGTVGGRRSMSRQYKHDSWHVKLKKRAMYYNNIMLAKVHIMCPKNKRSTMSCIIILL